MNFIRRALAACILAALFPVAALAQSAEVPPTSADEPAVVPGTQIAWPEHDHACDVAWDAQSYDDALPLCMKAATEYDAVIAQITAPVSRVMMIYNRAYTIYEIAVCYAKTDRVDQGHAYGLKALAVYHDIVDPIGEKKLKDATAADIHTRELFGVLLHRLHAVFSDIGTDDPADNVSV